MSLKAVFMGSPDFAVPSLRAVADACDLSLVVCQPDRPAGRGRKLRAPAVKEAALALDLPVVQPTKMKDGTLLAQIREHDPDVAIVVAFGRILPRDILAAPRHGCINVHGSLLPRWRGAAPIQRAVLAGDARTGVSIMAMDEGMDTGPVYTTASTPIAPSETSGELFERLALLGAETLAAFLRDFPDVPPARPQDHAQATHAPMLRKEEGWVDWHRPVSDIVNHVRGMDPWPGAFTHRDGEPLKLYRAQPSDLSRTRGDEPPGTVVDADARGVHVACLDGVIVVAELQPAGKRRMAASAYVAGRPFANGERLGHAADA